MKLKLSYGYPVPSADAANVTEYGFDIGDVAVMEGSDSGPAWDYETPISCSFRLEADIQRLLEESGLVTETDPEGYEPPRLACSLTWFATKTKQRGSSPRGELVDGVNELSLTLPGTLLGGNLVVTLIIALLEPARGLDNRLAPKALGTILWTSDKFVLPLEGEGSRFTMTPVNFTKTGIQPKDAMWLVRISDNLDLPVTTGVRVLVNTANKTTVSMLENPTTAEGEMWQKSLEAEIMTLLILHGVEMLADSPDDHDLEDGSLGESIVALMESLFPGESPRDLTAEVPRIASTVKASIFNGKGV